MNHSRYLTNKGDDDGQESRSTDNPDRENPRNSQYTYIFPIGRIRRSPKYTRNNIR